MKQQWILALAVAILTGCQTANSTQPGGFVWSRVDGQRISGNPALTKEFYAAFNGCQSQRIAALNGAPASSNVTITQSITVGSPPPALQVKPFDGSRFMAAAEAGNRAAAADSLFTSCMAAQGYSWGPRPQS